MPRLDDGPPGAIAIFVDGPWDGEQRFVRRLEPMIEVAVAPKMVLSFKPGAVNEPCVIERVRYTLRTIIPGVQYYAPANVPNMDALALLIGGYGKTAVSHDEDDF